MGPCLMTVHGRPCMIFLAWCPHSFNARCGAQTAEKDAEFRLFDRKHEIIPADVLYNLEESQ